MYYKILMKNGYTLTKIYITSHVFENNCLVYFFTIVYFSFLSY